MDFLQLRLLLLPHFFLVIRFVYVNELFPILNVFLIPILTIYFTFLSKILDFFLFFLVVSVLSWRPLMILEKIFCLWSKLFCLDLRLTLFANLFTMLFPLLIPMGVDNCLLVIYCLFFFAINLFFLAGTWAGCSISIPMSSSD